MIALTPSAPYYAVIFTSLRTNGENDYSATSERMVDLVKQQEGYLGHESVREGLGITISYWDSMEAIRNWKKNAEHLFAQENGRNQWYTNYKVRICKVERDYGFDKIEE